MSDLLQSVVKLFEDAAEFETMDSGRKASVRARLTRYLTLVEDDEVKGALLALRSQLGESEAKTRDKMTAEDVETEFAQFSTYEAKQRGAFKAKVSRLLNEAKETADNESIRRLASLQFRITQLEQREVKAKIMALAGKRKAGDNGND